MPFHFGGGPPCINIQGKKSNWQRFSAYVQLSHEVLCINDNDIMMCLFYCTSGIVNGLALIGKADSDSSKLSVGGLMVMIGCFFGVIATLDFIYLMKVSCCLSRLNHSWCQGFIFQERISSAYRLHSLHISTLHFSHLHRIRIPNHSVILIIKWPIDPTCYGAMAWAGISFYYWPLRFFKPFYKTNNAH